MSENWKTYGEFVGWDDCKRKFGPINTTVFFLFFMAINLLAIMSRVLRPYVAGHAADITHWAAVTGWVVLAIVAVVCAGKFFRRNIVGYNLWIFHDDEFDHHALRKLTGRIFPRYHQPNKGNILVVPIGGWFNRPKIIYGERDGINFDDHKCVYWQLERFMLFGDKNLYSASVMVQTTHHEKVSMQAGELIYLLDHFQKKSGIAWYPPAMPAGMALYDFLKAANDRRKERDALVIAIKDATTGLAASKRAIKSPIVKAVCDKLIADTLNAFPAHGQDYKKVDDTLHSLSAPAA